MAYDNNFTGFLARNERKSKPTDPDFSGSMEVAGIQYWLAGWTQEGKPGGKMEGKRFFSLKLTPKDAPRAAVAPRDDDMAPTPVAGAPKHETPPIPYRETKPAAPLSQVEKELDSADAPF